MHRELARVPAQVLLDKGLWPAARVCLSVMYLRIDNLGFCALTAMEIGDLMGTTAHTVRRHWGELIEAGYLNPHVVKGVPRQTRDIRGHFVALGQDGHVFGWARVHPVGSEQMIEELEGQNETA